MHFTTAAVIAFLAANALASPLPQIGGEAQACQGVVSGVSNGVGQGTAAALNNVAGNVGTVKGATKKFRFFRRQGNGLANACYDVVNNVDQGVGYTAQNVQAGAVGDQAGECTGNCAVGNAKRQLADIANAAQGVSNAAGVGAATEAATGAVAGGGNAADGAENSAGAAVGTVESADTADAGAAIGNAIGSVTGAATHGTASTTSGSGSGSGSAPPPPHRRRQLNKIASGTQDVGDALGVGSEVAPVTGAENEIDGVGTGSVGDAGHQVGGAIQGALVKAGSSVP